MEREIRHLPQVQLRMTTADDGRRKLAGYAALYNALSDDLGGFREQIAPGAFRDAIGGDVRALFDHDSTFVLGRTTAGTLRLSEDARGLAFEVDVPETTWARDLMHSVERGDINQMSFAFRALRDSWQGSVRTLHSLELFEVSLVTFPAYPQTIASVRARVAELKDGQAPGGEAEAAVQAQRARLEMMRTQIELMEMER